MLLPRAPFPPPLAPALLLLCSLPLTSSCCRHPEKTTPTSPSSPSSPNTLTLAKDLAATRFQGFVYGPRQDRNQIDCVQFTGAVVEKLLARPLTKEETDALYIRYHFENLDTAVASEDPRTKGIQRALTEFIKCGTTVEPSQIRPGDFVQYWIQQKDTKWSGHSALVTKVFTDAHGPSAIAIYSSNKATNGIAEMDFENQGLSLRKPARKFYFVRFTAPPKKR